ncbi:helix-turn-helix domain-containing protein [Williamsia sp.]|uniref:helix-turn-helix domain-containing protein n=1 Tax=Williamsia sp. TaxID=1872085 RepID=UPI001A1A3B1B|nr:helix-turn-helix domain-containing protein [Williamsia sp.]MBJ7290144.1 GAF domain-containing protein [Williamsia sp.]
MTSPAAPEPAVLPGDDPRKYAEILTAVYDATMAGDRSPARPRTVIGESWDRLMSQGISPDQQPDTGTGMTPGDLEMHRHESGLSDVMDDLARGLDTVITDGDNILVVADRSGRVLWRSGSTQVLSKADRLGFVEGANWAENSVGTNAIGTALVSRKAVQIFSAEHYVRSHHPWTCAGAPIHDPRTGDVIGAVDVSGPAATIHPTTVALVDVVAKLAESHLRELHRRTLDRLRSVAAPMLARMTGPAMAVDGHGWVAAVDSLAPHTRVLLPDAPSSGRIWVPALGACDLEPLPGGWLVRVFDDASDEQGRVTTQIGVDLRDPMRPMLQVAGRAGAWSHEPTPRHAEILYLLATHRSGLTAPQMAESLFGDDGKAITVRAEMSRLRRQLAGIVLGNPYRFPEEAQVDLAVPLDRARLLPQSTAPAIRRARIV